MTDKLLVGWREWLGLPDLGIDRIKVKLDTAARTSALHATVVRRFRRGGKRMVRFRVHPIQKSRKETVLATAPLIGERAVRSSNGMREIRPVILTTARLGSQVWPIEVTLTSRDEMGFRMLLGRQAMRGHLIVDPGRSFLMRKLKKRPVP